MLKRLYKEPNINQPINYDNIKNILEKIQNLTPYESIVIKNYIISLPPTGGPNNVEIYFLMKTYFERFKKDIRIESLPYLIPINEDNIRSIINEMLQTNSIERLIMKEYMNVEEPLPRIDLTCDDFKSALKLSAELTIELNKIK